MRGVLKPREERIAQDAYFTPQPLADEICRRLAEVVKPSTVWDPCCGGGAFTEAARRAWYGLRRVSGTDLPDVDFLKPHLAIVGDDADLIVSNPPYLLAQPFVERALSMLRVGGCVAFLLRLSFLCGQKRVDSLWSKGEFRYLMPITPRPSFTSDGKTDASEYGVFVWKRGYTGLSEILPHIRWKR